MAWRPRLPGEIPRRRREKKKEKKQVSTEENAVRKKLAELRSQGNKAPLPRDGVAFLEKMLWGCHALPEKVNREEFDSRLMRYQKERKLSFNRVLLLRSIFEKLVKDFSKGGKYASD
jgi:hypothetical protein